MSARVVCGHWFDCVVCVLVRFEGVFQTGHHFDKKKISEKADATLKAMDENKDGHVSLTELQNYFSKWTVDQMRRVTTDLLVHSRKRQSQHKLILDRLDSDKSGCACCLLSELRDGLFQALGGAM